MFGAWAAQHFKDGQKSLDIGAGTGLLSLMISQKHLLHIDAVEIEASCYNQLKENITLSNWKEQITPIHCNILDIHGSAVYDSIISNPPFYENQLLSDVHTVNLARHQTGLTLENLFKKVDEILRVHGLFQLLMPAFRKQECIDIASMYGFYPTRIADVKQSPRHDSFRVMFSFMKEKSNLIHEQITIKDHQNNYTEDFSALLKDYYLYL